LGGSGFFFCAGCASALEIKLQSKLNDARGPGRSDLAERAAPALVVRIKKLSVIEGIEELGAELERFVFSEGRLLVD
jgi:hypothetical protein